MAAYDGQIAHFTASTPTCDSELWGSSCSQGHLVINKVTNDGFTDLAVMDRNS